MPGRPTSPGSSPVRELPQRGFGSSEGRAAFIHAIAHIEFNAIDLAWDAVYRFRGMPRCVLRATGSRSPTTRRGISRCCADRLRDLGHDYGDFDAHNGLWEMAEKTAHDGLARMALVPRVLEARGLDVTPGMIEQAACARRRAHRRILDVILREEIAHVAAGSAGSAGAASAAASTRACGSAICWTNTHAASLRGPFNREARTPPDSTTRNSRHWNNHASAAETRSCGSSQATAPDKCQPSSASTRNTDPCSYQSPSTIRVPRRCSCTSGRCVWPWISRVDAEARKRRFDRRRRDIGDRLHQALRLQPGLVRLARRARLLRERQPRRQRLREELRAATPDCGSARGTAW